MSDNVHPEWIIDTTDESFEQDAVIASKERLILVDFWASWCQPCRLLTPNLEEAVGRFKGDVRLVKVNTEVAPETAQTFQVASIPTVYALLDGQPVDYFQGVIEADEIEGWIVQLLRHRAMLDADQLTDTDPGSAVQAWEVLVQDDEENPTLLIGLARAQTLSGNNEAATEIINKLEQRGFLEPEGEKVKAMITLAAVSDDSAVDTARQRHLENPTCNETTLKFAEALAADNQYEQAFELAIQVYKTDKLGVGKSAHQFLLTAFKALPEDNDLVHQYRRKLAMLMY